MWRRTSARTRGSAIDARTTRHAGYLASQRLRKRIEECFGWGKDGRPLRKMRVYGKSKVELPGDPHDWLLHAAAGREAPGRLCAGTGVGAVSLLDEETEPMSTNLTSNHPNRTNPSRCESEK